MIFLFLFVLAQATQTPLPPFWPVTGAGWITLVASSTALGYAIYDRIWAKAKRDAELNGYGKRVKEVEDWQKTFDAGATERALIMERISVSQEGLLRLIGAAEERANSCHVVTEKLGTELKQDIERVMNRMRKWERRSTLAAHGLEVELRARGILGPQPPAPPALPLPLEDEEDE